MWEGWRRNHAWSSSQADKKTKSEGVRYQLENVSNLGEACFNYRRLLSFLMIFKYSASWKEKNWNHSSKGERYEGFQSGLMSNHMYIWFYMVVGKWFAPCGKCEENWGHWAWVIGELSLRGMEVLPLSAGLRLLFTFQTEELRGTRRGETVGRNVP